MFSCSPHECAYCRAPIECGQRWVREKLYDRRSPATARGIAATTLTFSPEPKSAAGKNISCSRKLSGRGHGRRSQPRYAFSSLTVVVK
jgi:hypothetical protein